MKCRSNSTLLGSAITLIMLDSFSGSVRADEPISISPYYSIVGSSKVRHAKESKWISACQNQYKKNLKYQNKKNWLKTYNSTRKAYCTEYDYTLQATARNGGTEFAYHVSGLLSSRDYSVAILDNHAVFGDIGAGLEIKGYDTVKIRSNGFNKVKPEFLAWSFVFNRKPVAFAEIGQKKVSVGDVVKIGSGKSYDSDGNTLNLKWSFLTRPEGSGAILDGGSQLETFFKADREGLYRVQLIVNDGEFDSSPSILDINVSAAAGGAKVIGLSDSISPVSLVNITVPDAPAGSGASQVEGPAVGSLNYQNGQLSFISPRDLGEPYNLKFKIGDDTFNEYVVAFEPLIPAPVNVSGEGGDEGFEPSSQVSEDILAHVEGLVDGLMFTGSGKPLVFSLHDNSGAVAINPENYEVYLHSSSYQSVKNLFVLSPDGKRLELAASNVQKFVGLLGQGANSIELSGVDQSGRFFGLEFNFVYASNSLTGHLLNSDNQPVTPPAGSVISIRGLATNINFSVVPNIDGSFEVANVPTDSYEVSLIDPTGTLTGTSLFGVQGTLQNVVVDLLVNGGTQTATTNAGFKTALAKSVTSSRTSSTVVIEPKVGGMMPESPPSRIEPFRKALAKGAATAQKATQDVLFGQIDVFSGPINQTMQLVQDVQIPKGTGKVKVSVTVNSDEFPNFTKNPANPFNDSWRFEWSCGGFSDSMSGRVNVTHSTTGSRNYDREIDLTKATVAGPISCRIAAFTANIGDSIVETGVHVGIKGPSALSIRAFNHKEGLYKDKNNIYHMGIPVKTGSEGTRRKFAVELEYEPADADISSLKLEMRYALNQVLVSESQKFTKVKDGLLKADITLPELELTPDSAPLGQLLATLTGTVNGASVTTESKPLSFSTKADTFAALFETRNAYQTPATRRYDDRNDAAGGDGWGRYKMHEYLQTGLGNALMFNDVSGEHTWQDSAGKSMGIHREHKAGLSVDARYLDENGESKTPMRGDGNGATIKNTLDKAQIEVSSNSPTKPETLKIIQWIDQNRSFLNKLSTDNGTTKIYVGVADWHQKALIKGLFPDGTAIPRPGQVNPDNSPVLVGEWTDKPQKVKPMAGSHEGHIHVGMD